mgnify:CR=1 FL=1
MKQNDVSEKIKRKRNPKNSISRGNAYERRIAQELRDLGFTGVVTSRSESKRMDNAKVDLIDTEHKLKCLLQLKLTQATPNYFKIREECPIKDAPFCIIWNKTKPTDSTYRSEGEVVILDKDFFYKLIQNYYG